MFHKTQHTITILNIKFHLIYNNSIQNIQEFQHMELFTAPINGSDVHVILSRAEPENLGSLPEHGQLLYAQPISRLQNGHPFPSNGSLGYFPGGGGGGVYNVLHDSIWVGIYLDYCT